MILATLQESGTAALVKVRIGTARSTVIDLMIQKAKREGIVIVIGTVRRVEAERGKIMTGRGVERERGIGEDG